MNCLHVYLIQLCLFWGRVSVQQFRDGVVLRMCCGLTLPCLLGFLTGSYYVATIPVAVCQAFKPCQAIANLAKSRAIPKQRTLPRSLIRTRELVPVRLLPFRLLPFCLLLVKKSGVLPTRQEVLENTSACIRERGSVLYLGMAQEFLDFSNFQLQSDMAECQQPALQRDSRSLDHHCSTFKRTFEYAGGEKKSAKKVFCLSLPSSFFFRLIIIMNF